MAAGNSTQCYRDLLNASGRRADDDGTDLVIVVLALIVAIASEDDEAHIDEEQESQHEHEHSHLLSPLKVSARRARRPTLPFFLAAARSLAAGIFLPCLTPS